MLLLRLLTEGGARVRVVPTDGALRFVGEATWAALSGQPVAADVWTDAHEVPHVRLGREADLVVVAPATADLLARAAHGRADDLLTSTLLTARCPVLLAPAMHTEMWEHPAVRANAALLRERGVVVLDPASGRLTGADTGPGRLPEPEAVHAAALRLLARGSAAPDLAGWHVVVSAGGTREPLDPVRFLGNSSSGRQGYALAATAAARGARVTLVAAHTDALPDPAGARVVRAGTARQLREAVLAAAADADAVVMAAAVADFRPAQEAQHKIKKSEDPADADDALLLRLVRNPDVLADLVAARRAGGVPQRAVLVGFAAETGDERAGVLEHARRKLARKGCDLLVVNDVSAGRAFGSPENTVVLLPAGSGGADEQEERVGPAAKEVVADAVWDAVRRRAGALHPAG
ncbi:Phosphopantothenate-cysteine ligase /Phosphopantothenoylcysteine decarboxylase [Quadrisphaera sp. DSM 44207]|nr:Phosphopantothenate-cysteine ligase /Phosphopantothenoylcysteine decarboxylase [Quadrisphaera sp. DSM 44207]